MDTLPKDPFMLYSLINMKLRDQYPTFDELCATEGLDKTEVEKTLSDAGFTYQPDINQFR